MSNFGKPSETGGGPVTDLVRNIETGIGPMTDRFLSNIVNKLSNKNFQDMVSKKIVDPVMLVVVKKMQPYIYMVLLLYAILLFLIIYMIYKLNIINKKCK